MPQRKSMAHKGAGSGEDFEDAKTRLAAEDLLTTAKNKIETISEELAKAVQDKKSIEQFNSLFSAGNFKEAARVLKQTKLYNDNNSAHRRFVRYATVMDYGVDDIKRVIAMVMGAKEFDSQRTSGDAYGFRVNPYQAEFDALVELDNAIEITPDLKNTEEYQQLIQALPEFLKKMKGYNGRMVLTKTIQKAMMTMEGGKKKRNVKNQTVKPKKK